MSAIVFPPALTTANWDKQKTALAKDKAVAAKLNPAKVTDALKALASAYGAIDDSVFDDSGLANVAAAEEAIRKLDAAVKGKLKDLRGRAKLAEAALDEFAAAAEKLRKTLQGPSATVAVGVMGAAASASKAASALDSDVEKAADAARDAMVAALNKLKGQKAPVPTGTKPKETKASKFLRTKAIECIRKIKKPTPGAKPWRFMVVKGTPTITVCFLQAIPGGSHEKMLKSLIPKEKAQTLKDPKGEVIWEKNAITLVSDRLPMGLAKKMQEWLKKLTKLNAKVRIRKTTGGAVEESEEGGDLPDDLLKPDPAEVAARAQAGKDFTKRLSAMMAEIKTALAGPLPADAKADIKELVDSVTKHGKAQEFDDAIDDLDALEALLEEAAEPAAGAPPGSSSGPSAAAAPDAGGLSVRQLATARLEWVRQREHAVSEITRLARTLVQEFRSEPDQAEKVKEAVRQFQTLAGKLKTDLDNQLDAALNANDPTKRAQASATAKQTLKQVQSLLKSDPLMKELDGNELIKDMAVVAPMLTSLDAVEAALG